MDAEYGASLKKETPVTTEVPKTPLVTPPEASPLPPSSAKEIGQEKNNPKLKAKKKFPKQVEKGKILLENKLRQPELEDHEGFSGRRPLIDPFRVGEKIVLEVTYMNVVAGSLALEVKPFTMVNGKKAYHLFLSVKSGKTFSIFYSVDDHAESFLDFEDLVPHNLEIHVNESAQRKEIRSIFDWKSSTAKYWENKVTNKGQSNRKAEWKIEPYAQNVLSAAFYLRTFQLIPGKKLAFRVADDGKNMVFKGEVLRREILKTALGEIPTVVVKPEITIEGVFKPMGEILFWMTDDDRKFIVRIESKIRIGTLIAKLKEIRRE